MIFAAIALLFASSVGAVDAPASRVLDDAKAIDRVVEMSRDGMPNDVLRRIIDQDIDLLRGRHSDDTYDYARFDRLEAGRASTSFSVQPTGPDRLTKVEARGEFVYRVILDIPARRLLVAHNRPLWIDHVEIDYVPQSNAPRKIENVKVEATLQPAASKTIEFPEIARQATVRVFARADKESGYGNLNVTLVKAKIFDNPDSPYADAVTSAKSLQKALEQRDAGTVRAMAQRMVAGLQGAVPAATVSAPTHSIDVIAPPPVASSADLSELQAIEDLLTGNDAERRQAADRLHQLIRRLRSR